MKTAYYNEKTFWANVKKDENDCWIWQGSKSTKGFGILSFNGKPGKAAHRLAWEFYNKQTIPKGREIRHKCNVRTCCNPEHLELSTRKEIMLAVKGRFATPKGENASRAKLTNEQVKEIRELRATSKVTIRELAEKFEVSNSSIFFILKGTNYSDVETK